LQGLTCTLRWRARAHVMQNIVIKKKIWRQYNVGTLDGALAEARGLHCFTRASARAAATYPKGGR
jgi:hypothetical protein